MVAGLQRFLTVMWNSWTNPNKLEMSYYDNPGSPRDFIRWCLILTAVWLLNGVTLIYWVYPSLDGPREFRSTLTEQITATDNPAEQQRLNLRLLQMVENRVAALQTLQRRVIILAGGVLVTGTMILWVLVRLQRSLRRTYELRSFADLESPQ